MLMGWALDAPGPGPAASWKRGKERYKSLESTVPKTQIKRN